MKTIKILSLTLTLSLIYSCGGKIQLDDPNTKGTGPGALKVIQKAEKALKPIESISTEIEFTQDSDLYGHEELYQGTLKAEFGGSPGSLGNRWFEAKQNIKGKKVHIRGVFTSEGLKELHLLKNKVVKGNKTATSAAWIERAFYRPYGDKNFYNQLKNVKVEESPGFSNEQNVYLEAIENVHGRDCYVIRANYPKMGDRIISRYYFGVDDGHYYEESVESNTEDGKMVSKTLIVANDFNQALPEFDVEVPEDFTVEMYKDPGNAVPLKVGEQAPDWTLPNSNGENNTLSEEYTENIVLMDFWATWCGPCKAKMPHVQELYDTYKDRGLKVISVLSGDVGHEEEAAEYIEEHKYTFDLVFSNNELSEAYKIRFLPTVIMVDRTGKIIYHRDNPGSNDGVNEEEELEGAIKNALEL